MSYKLVKEHGDKYEMQHPNGEKFIIAKKGLNKSVVEHIKSLGAKGYADGGLVEEDASSVVPAKQDNEQFINSLQSNQPLPEYQQSNDYFGKNYDDAFSKPVKQVEGPAPASVPTMEQPAQAQEVIPQDKPQPTLMDQSYGNVMGGLSGAAKVEEGLAKERANVYGDLQQQYANLDAEHKKSQADTLQEVTKFQDAANKDVDPHRYWDSLSTGNKVSASIGIILGGIGAGMMRGDNQALKVIDQAINQDIDAQKTNASKNMNLYRVNLDKYKNAEEAHVRTKLELASLADLKLKQAEANAKSQESKFALQTARGELQAKYAPLFEQASQMKTQRQIMQMAQVNPEAITPVMAQFLPEKDRERFIPGLGFALDKAGADKVKMELKPDHDDAIQAIERMAQLRKKYGSEIMNREAVAEADTLKGILKGKLRTFLVGPGAVSESEQKILDDIIQDPTSLMANDASVYKRLETLKGAINNSYMNKAKLQGLDTSRQAQANLAPQIQTKNGIPYKKVSGGWIPLKTGK